MMAVEYIIENCPESRMQAPADARRTTPLIRRQRAECPRCYKWVALTTDDRFFRHWRIIGEATH